MDIEPYLFFRDVSAPIAVFLELTSAFSARCRYREQSTVVDVAQQLVGP